MALLLTGCPHNQYIVELTPRGPAMERRLTFYREDGVGTNGLPNYQAFPPDELALIGNLYPPGCVTKDAERRTVVGQFTGAMPTDVGGAGSYTSLTNSLGATAFYVERFRGNDDFTARAEKQSKAADQLTDIIIGWCRSEFGRERNFKNLRRFLDNDFRRDLKNLGFYSSMMQAAPVLKPEAPEEFAVRFSQYLVERGYLKVEDCPELFRISEDGGAERTLRVVQRLVAAKLGIPKSSPLPRAVAGLADPNAAWKSWRKYLTITDQYRARYRQWQKERMIWGVQVAKQQVADFLKYWGRTNPPSAPTSAPIKPDPDDVAAELTMELLGYGLFGTSTDDHAVIRLSLPSPPAHTNGKWDETRKQVVWESDLEDRTNTMRLPLFCYASWAEPNETQQQKHFGRLVLRGDDLTKYCLWHRSLDPKQAGEWDALLTGLQATNGWKATLDAFRFSNEPIVQTNKQTSSLADLPRELIKSGSD